MLEGLRHSSAARPHFPSKSDRQGPGDFSLRADEALEILFYTHVVLSCEARAAPGAGSCGGWCMHRACRAHSQRSHISFHLQLYFNFALTLRQVVLRSFSRPTESPKKQHQNLTRTERAQSRGPGGPSKVLVAHSNPRTERKPYKTKLWFERLYQPTAAR